MASVRGAAFDLTGHVALITGGNGGIGLGMAQALASAGADVAIWGTRPDKNDAAAELLRKTGRRVVVSVCDVSDEEQVVRAFGEAVEQLGKVDSAWRGSGRVRIVPGEDRRRGVAALRRGGGRSQGRFWPA